MGQIPAIEGTCDARFARVRDAFADNFATHDELGAGVAVVLDGQTVVDLWGGHADVGRTRPWRHDTLVHVYSTTKGVVALAAHLLADRGLLDLDAPVARYWPEFAAAGKGAVPVHHLLSHRVGLPAVRSPLPPGALFDWPVMTAALAAETPWWEPGTRFGYHILTYGFLVGEVIRRVSGRSVGSFVRAEIARRLGVEFAIGLTTGEEMRAAEIIPLPASDPAEGGPIVRALSDPESMIGRMVFNPPMVPEMVNTHEYRAAEIPAANGHTTARAVARIYGCLARGGELDGARLLRRETLARAVTEQVAGEDEALGWPTRLGMGFLLRTPEWCMGPSPRAFGHPGAGGSVGFADPDARLGFAYTPSRMTAFVRPELGVRADALIAATYASL